MLDNSSSSGNAQWAKSVVAGSGNSYFYSVAIDPSGNSYAGGSISGTSSYSFGNGVIYIVAGAYSSGSNAVLVKYLIDQKQNPTISNDWVGPVVGGIVGGVAAVTAATAGVAAAVVGSYCLYKKGVFSATKKVDQAVDGHASPSNSPEIDSPEIDSVKQTTVVDVKEIEMQNHGV